VSELSRLGRSFHQILPIVDRLIRKEVRLVAIAAKAKGKRLGHPKGAVGKSTPDGKGEEIKPLLQQKVSKASMARIVDVDPMPLENFIRTRQLQPSKRRPGQGP
jgi:hypothetical protein